LKVGGMKWTIMHWIILDRGQILRCSSHRGASYIIAVSRYSWGCHRFWVLRSSDLKTDQGHRFRITFSIINIRIRILQIRIS
jgi:hypothetical protein